MSKPRIPGAPGVVFRPRKDGWECRWQARTGLVARGYTPKSVQLWIGAELTDEAVEHIRQRSADLQDEMLIWGRRGSEPLTRYDGTLRSLIGCYQTDQDSTYQKLRFASRKFYDKLCKRLNQDHGQELISEIKARHVLRWHEAFEKAGKITMGHAVIGMLRTLSGFGATILENDECERLSGILSKMRFKMGKPRSERMTAEQATALRNKARQMGFWSIARAQAFQFDVMLRQKDVIGEWVPLSEPGITDTTYGHEKWLRGIRWEEVDDALILRHVTSKRQKEIEVDLKMAPMVVEELNKSYPGAFYLVGEGDEQKMAGDRSKLPASGPIIVCEHTGFPWSAAEFRRYWREQADKAGLPRKLKNMDSRAGAISEATDAGANLEDVRHAATHGDIQMTQRYSRGSAEKVAKVMELRAAHRKNSK